MSNVRHWDAPVKRYVDELLAGKTGPRGTDFNMRWVASMVADVHRIMSRGGVFMYPRDARPGYESGRLRLMYEGNPMAFLIEQAGGAATNGQQRILDIEPQKLHQRVAVFLGSKSEVERVTTTTESVKLRFARDIFIIARLSSTVTISYRSVRRRSTALADRVGQLPHLLIGAIMKLLMRVIVVAASFGCAVADAQTAR